MTNLWGLLSGELGSAFYKQFGQAGGAVFNHWTQELYEFTEQEIFAGLNKFKNSGSTYMSLNVFRNHCKVEADVSVMSDERAAKTLEDQRRLNADISEESKEKGKSALLGALNLMGSRKYKGGL
jgi:hypothetical protein